MLSFKLVDINNGREFLREEYSLAMVVIWKKAKKAQKESTMTSSKTSKENEFLDEGR